MKKLMNKIEKTKKNISKTKKEMKKIRNKLDKEKKKLLKNSFVLLFHIVKEIIDKAGYRLTIETDKSDTLGKLGLCSPRILIKGEPIYTRYNGTTEPSFEISMYIDGVYTNDNSPWIECSFKMKSRRYWEEKMYKDKNFTISLNSDYDKIKKKLYKEICRLVEVNNERLHHKYYKTMGEMALYSNVEPGFRLH